MKINSKLRKCIVNNEDAFFHRWFEYSEIVSPSMMVGGHCGGLLKSILGIVEFSDGRVTTVPPTMIHFINCNDNKNNTAIEKLFRHTTTEGRIPAKLLNHIIATDPHVQDFYDIKDYIDYLYSELDISYNDLNTIGVE